MPHLSERFGAALSVLARHGQIKCVVVRLSDTNGPRGGNDKCCRIQVVVPGHSDVLVEDTESDLYTAIDRATDRVSRTVARRLDRRRHFARQRLGAAGAAADQSAESLH